MTDSVLEGFLRVDRAQRMRSCIVHPGDFDALAYGERDNKSNMRTTQKKIDAWLAMKEAVHAEQSQVD